MKELFKREFGYAFYKTVPVMCGYIFLGIAFGISLGEAGYNWVWALLMSAVVYAGSLQFVMIPLLASNVSVMTMALTALFVNCRHIFYGLSFVESFQKIKQKLYMIFTLTDETYSVLCGCKQEDPEESHRDGWFFITLIDHSYWIVGSVIGAWLGDILPFDFTGIDFSMTALFIVILLEQMLSAKMDTKVAAVAGLVVGMGCLLVLGAENFLLPALLITVFLLSAYSAAVKKYEKEEGVHHG